MLLFALIATAAPLPAGAAAYITGTLHLTQYRAVATDLNGDGVPEVLAYAEGPEHCGSGGCDLYVLTRRSHGWRIVTRTSVTRLPIRMLPGKAHGWHDLGVHVAGGGILPGQDVRLRFNGARYLDNPSLLPPRSKGAAPGRILLR
ncbi:hypothetical protein [uncultured Sphingomonas sp.]|uniref:hypothetical protein n=1 Tax=uncultured Sphingomonas sp. TaxID=158754 RepID=UPI0025E2C71C|nr:hypothetical protein [uncultured Sphingomonas sp.]